jgi:dimethylsulfide dehydrogenase subunit gamma
MNKSCFTAALFCSLLAACSEQNIPVDKTPAIAIIDDTPVHALEVGGTVIMSRQAGADFTAPDSVAWREAQEYSMELSLAPPVHQSVNLRYDPATAPVSVNLRAGSDGEKLYLRMRWSDTTQDVTTSRDQFSDGAAVQFALSGGPATSYMMGASATPVNIWYWKAGTEEAQNLAAGGFGSTTPLERGGLSARSVYRDGGEWAVVFSRPLAQDGEHQVDLEQENLTIALALWQGEARQRDGLKHISPGWVTIQ